MRSHLKDLSRSKNLWFLAITSIIMVVSSLSFPKVGFLPARREGFTLLSHIVFPLCHANVFHLACNLLCLYQLRQPYYLIPSIIISFACSFLPCPVLVLNSYAVEFSYLPIMGFSGILFAIIGIKWGRIGDLKRMFSRLWPFLLVTAFIPNVAFLFHLYCIIYGFTFGYMITLFDLWHKIRRFQ